MACCAADGYSLFSGDDNSYGEKYQYDTSFKGPKSGRRPTDVVWLSIFLITMLVWITFGIFVLSHNPSSSIPDIHGEINFQLTFSDHYSYKAFQYLKQTWWYSFVTILFATAICLILIYTMRWIATPVVWLSMIFFVALLFICAITCFIYHSRQSDNEESNVFVVLGIVLLILGIIYAAVVYFLRRKIVVVITLIKEGSKAIGSIYSTVFFPILPLIFQLSFFVTFSCIAMSLSAKFERDAYALYVLLQLLNFFSFLWAFWFIEAFQKMVLACTFASWYWTLNKKDVPFYILTSATVRTTRYHLGTAAFGSVLVAAGQLICYMLRVVMNNRYMRICRLFCDITVYVERILKFLSKNAFIMCAIHGEPFCKSMRDAFNLLMRNLPSVYIVDRVTTFVFVLLSILVGLGMGSLTYYTLPEDGVQKDIMIFPVLISGFGSLLVAIAFFGVYTMAIDTLFVCFLEDCERNDGSELRPYYMSHSLMQVLHKNSDNLIVPI